MDPELRRAIELFSAGRRREAEAAVRAVLARLPDEPDALHLLGVLALEAGHPADTLNLVGRAAARNPGVAAYHVTLGEAHAARHQLREAESCYRRALALDPRSPEAWNNLGIALKRAGRLDEAVDAYAAAVRIEPELMAAWYNRAIALVDLGRFDEAVEGYRRALALAPMPVVHSNLGLALKAAGRLDEAIAACRQAVELGPKEAELHNNLGVVLAEAGYSSEAAAACAKALELDPRLTAARVNRGTALADAGRLGEAIASYRQALGRDPRLAEAHNGLGNALRDSGQPEAALASFSEALRLKPAYRVAAQNALAVRLYCPGVNSAELLAAHRAWVPPAVTVPGSPRARGEPVRWGFVSADFRRHPVGMLSIGLLENLAGVEVHVYSGTTRPDALTERFRAVAHRWRDTAGESDAALVEAVRADGVDVLFDLAGHTAGNRAPAFAARMAPLQVAWLGYAGPTGLAAMDAILLDRHHAPGSADAWFGEEVWRMPDGYATYDPPPAPEVGPPPSEAAGAVTFGCFNAPAKLTAPVLAAWAALLARVPEARLLVRYRGMDDPGVVERVVAALGVARERVIVEGAGTMDEMLAAYARVDVALDPFPYSGGVTTCEALWMGVPVVTWPGETLAGRHALSHLSVAGLTGTIASSAEDYVERAVELARDGARRAAWRREQRERVRRSPLCDPARFATALVTQVRRAWSARRGML